MAEIKERKDEIVLAALLANATIRGAATACGFSEKFIYGRLSDPGFQKKYDKARHDLLAQSTAYIQGIVSEAIQKMRDIMNNPDTAPQIQLNAAEAITRNSLKFTEQNDILRQLAELKKAVFPNE